MQAAVDMAVSTGFPLRVAVSCAGIGWASRTVAATTAPPMTWPGFSKVISVNLIGTFEPDSAWPPRP